MHDTRPADEDLKVGMAEGSVSAEALKVKEQWFARVKIEKEAAMAQAKAAEEAAAVAAAEAEAAAPVAIAG